MGKSNFPEFVRSSRDPAGPHGGTSRSGFWPANQYKITTRTGRPGFTQCSLSHREPLHSVQVLEVLVDQAGVLLHQVGVERPHHEAHRVSVQLAAQQLGQRLWRSAGQQLGARSRAAAAARCVQGLAKLVGVGGFQVDGDVPAPTVALRRRSDRLLVIVVVNLRRKMQT